MKDNFTIGLTTRTQWQVVKNMREMARKGSLSIDEPMPSSKELADSFNVSRVTMQHVLRQMEKNGWVKLISPRRRALTHRFLDQNRRNTELPGKVLLLRASPMRRQNIGFKYSQKNHGDFLFVQIGIMDRLHGDGFSVLTLPDQALEIKYLEALLSTDIVGVVSHSNSKDYSGEGGFFERCMAKGLPIVVMGSEMEFRELDTVDHSHADGESMLVEELAKRGCQRILRYWIKHQDAEQSPFWLSMRNQGYDRAVGRLSLPNLEPLVCTVPPVRIDCVENFNMHVNFHVGSLLPFLTGNNPVDAVQLLTDHHAPEVIAACRKIGKTPLVTGYDDCIELADGFTWEKTGPDFTVDKCNEMIGREMARMLTERLTGKYSGEARHINIPSKLVFSEVHHS